MGYTSRLWHNDFLNRTKTAEIKGRIDIWDLSSKSI
jgi:hypothetical protein